MLEFVNHVARGLESLVDILGEASAHHVVDNRRYLRLNTRHRRWIVLENGGTDVGHRIPFERRPPRQHLEGDGAERKQSRSAHRPRDQ